jgi:hypothetical protein
MVCGPLPTKATLAIRENATTKDRYNFDRGFVRYAGDIEILREGTGELQARGRGGRGRARESKVALTPHHGTGKPGPAAVARDFIGLISERLGWRHVCRLYPSCRRLRR